MDEWIYVFIITLVPWIELRGSIPYGILKAGLNPVLVLIMATVTNIIVIYPAFIFLDWFFELLNKTFMRGFIKRTHERVKPYVEKYGMNGLALFVAFPFPGTGAYSGALAAHIFGMKNKKAFTSIALGITIAGVLVTLITLFFRESLGFLLKIL